MNGVNKSKDVVEPRLSTVPTNVSGITGLTDLSQAVAIKRDEEHTPARNMGFVALLGIGFVICGRAFSVLPFVLVRCLAAGGSKAKQSFFGKASNQAILKNVRKEVIPTAEGLLWDAYGVLSTWSIPPERLSAGNIPIYMWYAASDEVIPLRTAQAFALQLRKARLRSFLNIGA